MFDDEMIGRRGGYDVYTPLTQISMAIQELIKLVWEESDGTDALIKGGDKLLLTHRRLIDSGLMHKYLTKRRHCLLF